VLKGKEPIMFDKILTKAVSLGLAAMVSLAIIGSIEAMAPQPMQGSLLAAAPAANADKPV
jgi:hypothetical protein